MSGALRPPARRLHWLLWPVAVVAMCVLILAALVGLALGAFD